MSRSKTAGGQAEAVDMSLILYGFAILMCQKKKRFQKLDFVQNFSCFTTKICEKSLKN